MLASVEVLADLLECRWSGGHSRLAWGRSQNIEKHKVFGTLLSETYDNTRFLPRPRRASLKNLRTPNVVQCFHDLIYLIPSQEILSPGDPLPRDPQPEFLSQEILSQRSSGQEILSQEILSQRSSAQEILSPEILSPGDPQPEGDPQPQPGHPPPDILSPGDP